MPKGKGNSVRRLGSKAVKRVEKKVERKLLGKSGANWSAGLSIGGFKLGMGNGMPLASKGQFSALPPKSMGDRQSAVKYTGRDLMGTVGSGTEPGDVLFDMKINPMSMSVTRLARIASLYEKYKFVSAKFVYEPACSALTPGALLGYVMYDVGEDIIESGGSSMLQIAASNYGATSTNVYTPTVWALRNVDPSTSYYVDETQSDDPRLCYQGRFIILDVDGNAVQPGSVYLEYELELYIPQMGPSSVNGSGVSLTGGGTMDNKHIWGDATIVQPWSNVAVEVAADGASISLPTGYWLIMIETGGTVITSQALALTNATFLDGLSAINAAATAGIMWNYIHITAADVSAGPVIASNYAATTVTNTTTFIARLPEAAAGLRNTTEGKLLSKLAEKAGIDIRPQPLSIEQWRRKMRGPGAIFHRKKDIQGEKKVEKVAEVLPAAAVPTPQPSVDREDDGVMLAAPPKAVARQPASRGLK